MSERKQEFTIKTIIPASPESIFDNWVATEGHSKMTGGEAECSDEIGASFTAWDGYISGKNLELNRPSLIIQEWRTSEFADEDPNSRIEIHLSESENGTDLTLIHTGIPAGQPDYEQGWEEFYFSPMRDYFSDPD